jgi:hypothetical protein
MAKEGHRTAVVEMLRDAIFTHPTMSEGLNGLLASVPVKSTQRSA